MKCNIDETPENICGGSVLEIGGRDHVLILGAGVESVLHTVRMAGITHLGASPMIVDAEPLIPALLTGSCCRDIDGDVAGSTVLLFRGVDLVGVPCSVRGVAVLNPVPPFFVGVVVTDEGRVGVPATDPYPVRFVETVLLASDRSRNAYSFL